jgi:copper chaperone CopZ
MSNILSLKLLTFAAIAVLASAVTFAIDEDISPEAEESDRRVAAEAKLKAESSSVTLYAKGLCCPSCSIGVRKMVSKLDFVDRNRFNKGVELDTKMQLVSVAVREGANVNYDSLATAVEKAGYDPVRAYSIDDGALKTQSLVAR